MTEGDRGATLHAEFNKHVVHYQAKYTNPVTSGQIQDALRNEHPDAMNPADSSAEK